MIMNAWRLNVDAIYIYIYFCTDDACVHSPLTAHLVFPIAVQRKPVPQGALINSSIGTIRLVPHADQLVAVTMMIHRCHVYIHCSSCQ